MKNKIVVIIIAVVIVVGAAIALTHKSSNKDSDMKMNTSNTKSQTTQNAVQTDKVSIENFAFSPATITVKVGTTVTWTNNDSTQHTVTSNPANSDGPKSGELSKGDTYSFMFTKAGTFTYDCEIHPSMQGTVIVTE